MGLLKYASDPFRNVWLRQFSHMQHEYDAHNLGIASAKIPPSWSPERDRQYPLRTWVSDVRLWAVGTDVEVAKQGPVCAMRIGGSAKELIRELDVNVLSAGGIFNDNQGQPAQYTGLECLIRALERRYAPLEQELEIHVIAEMLQFRRNPNEDTDSVVNRFNLVRGKALQGAGFDMSWVGFAFLLLTVLGIPKTSWPLLLAPTQGALPRDQVQYEAFCQYVRRQGHLTDRGVDTVKNMTFWTWTEQQETGQHSSSAFPALTTWHETPVADSSGTYMSSDMETVDDADDGLSSCNSGDSVPDLSDLQTLPENLAGEQLYLAYRHAKRRWRRFTGGYKRLHYRRHHRKGHKGSRKGHSFGKGFQGKTQGQSGKGKGKGKGRMFFLDNFTGELLPVSEEFPTEGTYMSEPVADDEQIVFLANKPGKFKRKNPKGKDGKTLECSMCGSEDHLIRGCPRNTQGLNFTQHQQQKSGKAFPAIPSSNASSSSGSNSGNQWTMPTYFGTQIRQDEVQQSNCVIECEGQTIQLSEGPTSSAEHPQHYYMPEPHLPKNPTLSQATSNSEALKREFMFAWFMPFYHANVRGEGFEGLLIDVGAIGNLCGSEFIDRIHKKAMSFGQGVAFQKMDRSLTVEGVGKESEQTSQEAVAPICLPDGKTGTFTSPIIANSPLPALLGLNTLTKERALIDCFNRQIVFVGKGGYRLQTSPGSRTYKLASAKTGHLLLPCDCWEMAKVGEKQLVF